MALSSNFESETGLKIRQMLIERAPKYGCDIDYVDYLLREAYNVYIEDIKKYKNTRFGRGPIGGHYYAGTSSVSANVPFGAIADATPDGRKAFTPLAEGSSPSSGTDTQGPTAVFKSVSKLPIDQITGGVLLNQKIIPNSLKNEQDARKFSLLLRTFFDTLKGFPRAI